MGWAHCGTDSQGRPIGYAHAGTCDFPGCGERIDRGLSYACGDMHGEDEFSCEGYFCHKHLLLIEVMPGRHVFLCPTCASAAEPKKPLLNGELSEPNICGRCYADCFDLFPAKCAEKPELLRGQPIGQYHCPDCGAMVLAGLPHPKMCQQCIERRELPSMPAPARGPEGS